MISHHHPPDPIRVFIVDDHRAVLWGLTQLIESASPRMRLVGTACNREEMLSRVHDVAPDVVLLDLDLGGENAASALPDLVRETDTYVLVLTGSRDIEIHQQAMLQGARGVVQKDEEADVVLTAIEKVHAGEIWLNRAAMSKVLGALVGGRRPPRDDDTLNIESLTEREREIIAVAVEHQGAANKTIARHLHISEHTLRNHLSIIYRKLGIRGRIELYIYAAKHGLGRTAAATAGRL